MVPITIVDNFLENPNEIIEFSSTLKYLPSPDGRWPGKRTPSLNDINPSFKKYLESRILSLFLPLEDIVSYESDVRFHLVSDISDKGWIHSDAPYDFSCILYLNKDNNKEDGTSLYKLKSYHPIETLQDHTLNFNTRINHHKEGILNKTEINQKDTWENKNFIKTQEISSQFNRLLIFPSNIPHAANKFPHPQTPPRLTLTTFFKNISSRRPFPLNRSNNIPFF